MFTTYRVWGWIEGERIEATCQAPHGAAAIVGIARDWRKEWNRKFNCKDWRAARRQWFAQAVRLNAKQIEPEDERPAQLPIGRQPVNVARGYDSEVLDFGDSLTAKGGR